MLPPSLPFYNVEAYYLCLKSAQRSHTSFYLTPLPKFAIPAKNEGDGANDCTNTLEAYTHTVKNVHTLLYAPSIAA